CSHWLRLPANSRPAGSSLLIVGRMAASQLASTDEASQRRNRVYTVPNAITAGRLVAAPCVAACVLSGSYAPAAAITLAAGLSDGLDGWVARRWPSQRSLLGSLLDPLADKTLVAALSLSLGYVGLLPAQLVALYIGRDLLLIGGTVAATVTGGGSDLLAKAQEVQPLTISKANTALQLATLGGALCCPLIGAPFDAAPLQLLWWMSAFTTGLSGLGYALHSRVLEAQQRLSAKPVKSAAPEAEAPEPAVKTPA
ncbi:hypothetical protein BOX15_Mlig000793g2, partial [Macrostomum lignano]